jgi:hypothetical protein
MFNVRNLFLNVSIVRKSGYSQDCWVASGQVLIIATGRETDEAQ